MELYGIFIAVIKKLTVTSAVAFVMASAVAGLFTGIADTVQYFRYSRGFPETDFTMNLVAGIAAFLMLAFSVRTAVGLRRHNTRIVLRSMTASTATAFLPRPPIGCRQCGWICLPTSAALAHWQSFCSACQLLLHMPRTKHRNTMGSC